MTTSRMSARPTRRTVCGGLAAGLFAAPALLTRAQGQTQTASLAWTPGPTAPQVALAIDRNLWGEAGLGVKVFPFPTGREALEALLGGQVDFAVLAELPVVTAAMRGQSFGVLSIMSRYRANRLIINKDSGVKNIAGLAGRKVATTIGTNVHFLADIVFAEAGVKPELVNIAPPDIVPALARGDVDAAFMFDSFFPQAQRILGARYLEIATPQYSTSMVIAGTTDAIEKRPDATRAMLTTLLKAEAALKDADAAIAAVSQSTSGALTADAYRTNWPNYEYVMKLDQELLDVMLKQGKWLQGRGLVKVEPTAQLLRGYVKDAPLRALAAPKVSLT